MKCGFCQIGCPYDYGLAFCNGFNIFYVPYCCVCVYVCVCVQPFLPILRRHFNDLFGGERRYERRLLTGQICAHTGRSGVPHVMKPVKQGLNLLLSRMWEPHLKAPLCRQPLISIIWGKVEYCLPVDNLKPNRYLFYAWNTKIMISCYMTPCSFVHIFHHFWKLKIFPLLGIYAAWNGSFLPMFQLTTYRSHIYGQAIQDLLTSWPLEMGPIGCHETSVRNYHSTLRKLPGEGRSRLHHGGNLKSHNSMQIWCFSDRAS